jgi:hypothetical protein
MRLLLNSLAGAETQDVGQAWSLTSLHQELLPAKRLATELQQADHGLSGPGKPGNIG